MFTKTQILASLAANGCTKLAANLWTDGEHNFRTVRGGQGWKLDAAPVNGPIGMRAALRPLYFAKMAAAAQDRKEAA